jgi:hypothetical protein
MYSTYVKKANCVVVHNVKSWLSHCAVFQASFTYLSILLYMQYMTSSAISNVQVQYLYKDIRMTSEVEHKNPYFQNWWDLQPKLCTKNFFLW